MWSGLMSTTLNFALRTTSGTPGSPSSGSIVSTVDLKATHRRTANTTAPVAVSIHTSKHTRQFYVIFLHGRVIIIVIYIANTCSSMDKDNTGSCSCTVLLFGQRPSGVQRNREAALFWVNKTGYISNLHFYWQFLIMATINTNSIQSQNIQTDWLNTHPHTYTHTIWIHADFRFIWRYPLWLWVHPPFISLYPSPTIFLSLFHSLHSYAKMVCESCIKGSQVSCILMKRDMKYKWTGHRKRQKEMRCGGGKWLMRKKCEEREWSLMSGGKSRLCFIKLEEKLSFSDIPASLFSSPPPTQPTHLCRAGVASAAVCTGH